MFGKRGQILTEKGKNTRVYVLVTEWSSLRAGAGGAQCGRDPCRCHIRKSSRRRRNPSYEVRAELRWGIEVEGPFQAHEPRAVVETQIPNEGTETYEAARSHNILSGCLSTSPMWHLSKYIAFYNVALRQHKKNPKIIKWIKSVATSLWELIPRNQAVCVQLDARECRKNKTGQI